MWVHRSNSQSPTPATPHPARVSPFTASVRAREQEVHYQPLRWHIESHRFVIQYTASLCAAHTANPYTVFLSVFPPPPTVLLTSLHTGETEQLKKQASGGKFLKVFWAHPTWGEHSKKNRKGWVGAPAAPTHKPGIVTPAHPRSQQGLAAGSELLCPHTKICKCVFCEGLRNGGNCSAISDTKSWNLGAEWADSIQTPTPRVQPELLVLNWHIWRPSYWEKGCRTEDGCVSLLATKIRLPNLRSNQRLCLSLSPPCVWGGYVFSYYSSFAPFFSFSFNFCPVLNQSFQGCLSFQGLGVRKRCKVI